MYASVTTGQIQPDKLDEFLAILQESIVSQIKDLPGLKNFSVLTDEKINKFMITATYETEADAERTQTSGDGPKIFGGIISLVVPESATREGYEVSINI